MEDVTEQSWRSWRRESEQRFREILERMHLLAVTLDEDRHDPFCNDYLLVLTGWTREELLGRTVRRSDRRVTARDLEAVEHGLIRRRFRRDPTDGDELIIARRDAC